MNLRWLFVYGTLRPSSGNSRMLTRATAMPPFEDCLTGGRMYHVPGGTWEYPIYPVVDFDGEGTVTGTLLLVKDDTEGFIAAHRMEVGAGYKPVMVEVTVPGWHHTVLALAYHFPHDDRGPEVPSGDWHQERARSGRDY